MRGEGQKRISKKRRREGQTVKTEETETIRKGEPQRKKKKKEQKYLRTVSSAALVSSSRDYKMFDEPYIRAQQISGFCILHSKFIKNLRKERT